LEGGFTVKSYMLTQLLHTVVLQYSPPLRLKGWHPLPLASICENSHDILTRIHTHTHTHTHRPQVNIPECNNKQQCLSSPSLDSS